MIFQLFNDLFYRIFIMFHFWCYCLFSIIEKEMKCSSSSSLYYLDSVSCLMLQLKPDRLEDMHMKLSTLKKKCKTSTKHDSCLEHLKAYNYVLNYFIICTHRTCIKHRHVLSCLESKWEKIFSDILAHNVYSLESSNIII